MKSTFSSPSSFLDNAILAPHRPLSSSPRCRRNLPHIMASLQRPRVGSSHRAAEADSEPSAGLYIPPRIFVTAPRPVSSMCHCADVCDESADRLTILQHAAVRRSSFLVRKPDITDSDSKAGRAGNRGAVTHQRSSTTQPSILHLSTQSPINPVRTRGTPLRHSINTSAVFNLW